MTAYKGYVTLATIQEEAEGRPWEQENLKIPNRYLPESAVVQS